MCQESSGYETRVKQVKEFNSLNQWVKQGISLIPVKFSASWTAVQHIALVNIYPDGSISIHQSGCEMGQGLDVKVAQVGAPALQPFWCKTNALTKIILNVKKKSLIAAS